MGNAAILLVEDDSTIAELLEYNLKNGGYEVKGFRDGQALFRALPNLPPPDLFILDLMLPGISGFDICAQLRRDPAYEWTPILMLTARGAESDKVRGLDAGADDYLTKPFGMRELLARVHALIRRHRKTNLSQPAAENESRPAAAPALDNGSQSGQIACGGIMLDDIRHRVYKGEREIEMTNREFELLKYLMIHRGVAFSRDELLNRVWGYDYSGETRTVDVHVRQLRRKLEDNAAEPVFIETVRGRGYRWTDQA